MITGAGNHTNVELAFDAFLFTNKYFYWPSGKAATLAISNPT